MRQGGRSMVEILRQRLPSSRAPKRLRPNDDKSLRS